MSGREDFDNVIDDDVHGQDDYRAPVPLGSGMVTIPADDLAALVDFMATGSDFDEENNHFVYHAHGRCYDALKSQAPACYEAWGFNEPTCAWTVGHDAHPVTEVGPGGSNSWATCACGWGGPTRFTRAEAQADADGHNSAVTAQGVAS